MWVKFVYDLERTITSFVLYYLHQKKLGLEYITSRVSSNKTSKYICRDISKIYLEIHRNIHNLQFVPSCSLFLWLPCQKSLTNTKSNRNFKNSIQQNIELDRKSKPTLNLNNWGDSFPSYQFSLCDKHLLPSRTTPDI